MARSSNATSDWNIQQSVGPLSGSNGPFTLAFWFKAGTNAQSNAYVMGCSAAGSSNHWAVIYEFVDNTLEFFTSGHTGTAPRTDSGLSIADTNWHHVAYRKGSSGASTWDKFLDGSKTEISASIDFTLPGSLNRMTFFAVQSSAGLIVNEANAALQEMATWTVALTDDRIAALAKGFSPHFFRSSGTDYYPFIGRATAEPNLWRGGGATVTNVIQADHSRMIYPRRKQAWAVAAAVGGSTQPPRTMHQLRMRA